MTHEHYMNFALREARNAYEAEEVPVGAVIVLNDKIIARGHNQVETLKDSTAHAEIIALTSAFNFLGAKYLPGAILYVTIEPCLMCAGALYWSKIATIVYGADDEKNGYRKWVRSNNLFTKDHEVKGDQQKLNPEPFHQQTNIVQGILKEECADLMKSFFKARR